MFRKLVIVILSVFTAAPAFSQSCGNHDLLADLQRDEPARYAALKLEAKAMSNGEAILWRLEKDGLPASYLFGTMHVPDPRITKLSDKALAAINDANRLIVEVDLDKADMETQMSQFMAQNLALFMGDANDNLNAVLSAEEKLQMSERLKPIGAPFEAFAPMKPWFPALMLSIPTCSGLMATGDASEPVLDEVIRASFVDAGKPTIGLETLSEQLGTFADIPIETQTTWLKTELAMGGKGEAIFESMTRAYLRRELPLFMTYSMSLLGDEAKGAVEQVNAALLDDRNVRMFERSKSEAAKGGVFIAVGALHLPGDTGLVQLYRDAGYEVIALD
jgi:uncharacterized protein YbaP (TraB family)